MLEFRNFCEQIQSKIYGKKKNKCKCKSSQLNWLIIIYGVQTTRTKFKYEMIRSIARLFRIQTHTALIRSDSSACQKFLYIYIVKFIRRKKKKSNLKISCKLKMDGFSFSCRST